MLCAGFCENWVSYVGQMISLKKETKYVMIRYILKKLYFSEGTIARPIEIMKCLIIGYLLTNKGEIINYAN